MIMGLSSKQVSGDGFDWSQGLLKGEGLEIPRPPPSIPPAQPAARQPAKQRQPVVAQQQPQAAQQQQGPPLRCPRCDSTNTKFCYYNNYSRSQPRHLCKACRRHWTDGGTLRNVPVGGGRKAKRPKTSHPSSSADPTTNDTHGSGGGNSNDVLTIHPPPPEHPPPLSFASDILCSVLLPPPLPLPPLEYANSSFLGSLLTAPTAHRFAGATSVGMIDGGVGNPFSASPTFPSLLNLTGHGDFPEVDAIAATISGSVTGPPTWDLLPPTCSSVPSGNTITTTSSGLTVMEESSPPSSGYWGSCWDDLAGFLSPDNKHPPPSSAPAPPQYFQLS